MSGAPVASRCCDACCGGCRRSRAEKEGGEVQNILTANYNDEREWMATDHELNDLGVVVVVLERQPQRGACRQRSAVRRTSGVANGTISARGAWFTNSDASCCCSVYIALWGAASVREEQRG